MALKDWKRSSELWFYKPGKRKGYMGESRPDATLNAVKFGTDYDIYYDKDPTTAYLKPIKRVNSKKEAISFMQKFMRKN